jgi:predicted nucleic acid-binding protein
LDASVGLKLLVDEDGSAVAATLLDGRRLVAPELIHVEVANALWRMVKVGRLSGDEAADALSLFGCLPLRRRVNDRELVAEAYRLSRLLDHPVYDCLYLALAIIEGVPVVTADTRFVTAATRDAASAPLVIDLATL